MTLKTGTLQHFFFRPLVLFMLLFADISHSYASTQQRDPALEQKLDQLSGVADYPQDKIKLRSIVDALTESVPAESYARVKGYQSLSMAFDEHKVDAALELTDSVLAMPTIQSSPAATAELLAVKADIYLNTNQVDKSLQLIAAIEHQLAAVENPRIGYYCHNVIGRVLQANRKFESALEHLLKAHTAVGDTDDAATHSRRQFLNLHISRVQLSLQNFKVALELLDKTIAEASKYNLPKRLPELYLNRAYAARELHGLSAQSSEDFIQAAKLGKEQGNKRVELAGYNNAGAGLLLLKNYQRAEQYLTQARAIASSINNSTEGTVIDFNLGYIKVMRGDFDTGLVEMRRAAEQFSTFAPASQVAQIQGLLADAYAVAGRYQLQAQALKEQQRLKDEFFQSERDKVFSELQIKYQAQENALQIKLLEQQTELQRQELDNRTLTQRLILLAVLLVLVIAALLFFAYASSRKVNQLLSKNNQILQQQSVHDPLTGLLNRRAVQHYMADSIADATPAVRRKTTGEQAIFLLDIDHFKQINDGFGHAAGDEILIAVAQKLKALCRTDDLVIRWGGEEFLLVLQHSHPDTLPELAKRILQEIASQPLHTELSPNRVTLSGGYISLPVKQSGKQHIHWETALKLADHLLYQAKAKGRNQIIGLESFDVADDQPLFSEQELLQRLISQQCSTVTVLGPV